MIKRLLKLDPRWYVATAIILQMFLAWRLQGPVVLKHTLSICLIACVLDFIMIFLTKRRAAFPLSALVSGLIISRPACSGKIILSCAGYCRIFQIPDPVKDPAYL